MQLNDVLLESLLHQEEGPSLDFKRSQYPFKKASSTQSTEDLRSELVKDILAFANTRRELPAYILIGVKEVKGSRSKVIGVSEHLSDNELHDFMNRRTQRPIEFSYVPYQIDGVEIGVIEIPVQERLIYLTKSYGKLHENVVYVRDGSSTRSVRPEEIAEMSTPIQPSLVVDWVDSSDGKVVQPLCKISSIFLYPTLDLDEIPSARPPSQSKWHFYHRSYNSDYPQELVIYTFHRNLYKPLGLRIHNQSGVTGKNIRFEGWIAKQDKFRVMDAQPSFPLEYYDFLFPPPAPEFHTADAATMCLSENDESWRIIVEFGDVRPDEQVFTEDNLWFGSALSGCVTMNGKFLGENLPEPIHCSLEIEFESQQRPMTIKDVEHAKTWKCELGPKDWTTS